MLQHPPRARIHLRCSAPERLVDQRLADAAIRAGDQYAFVFDVHILLFSFHLLIRLPGPGGYGENHFFRHHKAEQSEGSGCESGHWGQRALRSPNMGLVSDEEAPVTSGTPYVPAITHRYFCLPQQ